MDPVARASSMAARFGRPGSRRKHPAAELITINGHPNDLKVLAGVRFAEQSTHRTMQGGEAHD
jgi:hypothetical protein